MPEYLIPKEGSKGNSYHIVNHGSSNLREATEDEVRMKIQNGELNACGHCMNRHGMIKLEPYHVS